MRVCHELESRAEDYVELEQICQAPLPKDYPRQYPLDDSRISPEQFAEDVAQEERNRLGLGNAPISNLRAVFEEAVGLRIFFYEMPPSVAGLFGYNDRLGGCIGVNIGHPWYRGNWSLAHEYGHFLTTRFCADVDIMQKGRWGKHRAERFADSFAANFLMPRGGVNRRLSEVEMSGKERVTIADLVTLADYFGVSVQAYHPDRQSQSTENPDQVLAKQNGAGLGNGRGGRRPAARIIGLVIRCHQGNERRRRRHGGI
jgi:Zn-dependent peptidase ImmA (M78 family)